MKKIFLWCLFIGISQIAFAQILTIKDQETDESIPNAIILSKALNEIATTNAEGQADISALKDEKDIEIHMTGYKTKHISYAAIESAGFVVLLNSVATQLDDVVISATRWAQPLNEVPSKITTISPRFVALQNTQTAADMLGASGEVFIQKSQLGGGSPMIRGFATNRLLYSFDGVRMNSAIFRAGNLQNVISLDPFTIENTEVFFGPGSVIYGSDAIGGVMSFQTITPQFSLTEKPLFTGKAVSRFSSANKELTNHFDIQVGWKKLAMATSLTYATFGDLKMGTHGPDDYLKTFYVERVDSQDVVVANPNPLVQTPSGYSQINLMQKIHFSPSKKWDFQYGFHYSETSAYPRYDRLIERQSSGLPTSAVWNYGPQLWMMHNLSASHHGNNKVYNTMTLRIAQQRFEESRIDRRFNHHRLRTNLEEVEAYSVNLDFEKILPKNKFYYGAEFVLNDITSTGSAIDIRDGSDIAVPDRYPASTWSSYAAYLNYQFHISPKMLLQAGARYSVYKIKSDFTRHLQFFPFDFTKSEINNSALTGSLGLVYRPDETWKINASASTGFRSPNVDDIGKIFDFSNGEIVVPNTSLKAEYAYNGEIGIAKIWGNRVKLDITAFYTYLDNAMVRRPFQAGGQDSIIYDGAMSKVYAIQNAASSKVYGFNAGLEIKLPAGFSLYTRYNYQTGKEEMDNGELASPRHAAPAFGLSRLSYEKNKLILQLYVNYSAEVSHDKLNLDEGNPTIYAKDENGNPYSPSWYTLNYKAMYQFHPHFSISAGLENITDQRYRPFRSGITAPGRNFIMSLKANF